MERWQDVYHKLDPREPLEINDERLERSLYVNDFFVNVKDTLLLNGGRNFKLLFSGHTGCGKSTFLNLLFDDEDIQSEFHSIKYSIKDILDPNDIDHVDLLYYEGSDLAVEGGIVRGRKKRKDGA